MSESCSSYHGEQISRIGRARGLGFAVSDGTIRTATRKGIRGFLASRPLLARKHYIQPVTHHNQPRVLHPRKELTDRHSQGIGNPHKRIDGDRLLTPLDLADVVAMQIGLLGEHLLRKIRGFAVGTNSIADDAAVFGTGGGHDPLRQQGSRLPSTVYSLYFPIAFVSLNPVMN